MGLGPGDCDCGTGVLRAGNLGYKMYKGLPVLGTKMHPELPEVQKCTQSY